MNLAHVHLSLNHIPILGTIIAVVLFVVSLVGKREELKQVSLTLFALIALVSIPTYMSGNAAQDAIKNDPDVSAAFVEAHQGVALLAFMSMEITGGVALIALWPFSRPAKHAWLSGPGRLSLSAVLVLSIVTSVLMAITGTTGGVIRHPEILSGEQITNIIGRTGFAIVTSVQHFVIDSSMWVWPILEDLHFLGLILLLGTTGAFNLRIMGFLKQLPVAPLHRFLAWGIAGFVINIITGMLFFMGMPGFYTVNVVFQVKMFTILIAGGSLLVFYCTSAFREVKQLGPGEEAPIFAKVIAASSIILWIAVIVLGRYIPYGEVT